MKLTIVETGLVNEAIRDRFAGYPDMFRKMFASVDAGLEFETVSVVNGEALPDPAKLEAVLYTGSKTGVYDDEPWIAPLMDFIRGVAETKTPQLGFCFGHQVMAEALGGKVTKSEKGWGVGRHTYDLPASPAGVIAEPRNQMRVAVSHQDQVVVKPEKAQVVARSDFTNFGGLEYPCYRALSFQCHPEFEPDFAAALYKIRRGGAISEEKVDAAIESLSGECDRKFLARWVTDFVQARH